MGDRDMLTEKDYCDYELVLELKELGYDYIRREGLIHLYDAQKWLREEKDMNVNIRAFVENGWYYTIQDCKGNPICSQLMLTEELYSTYEKAFSEGIKEAVKILKEK